MISVYIYIRQLTLIKNSSTGNRTLVLGFRVRCPNHWTTEDMISFTELCVLSIPIFKLIIGKRLWTLYWFIWIYDIFLRTGLYSSISVFVWKEWGRDDDNTKGRIVRFDYWFDICYNCLSTMVKICTITHAPTSTVVRTPNAEHSFSRAR